MLVTIADLSAPEGRRAIAITACAINSGATRCAARWLIETLETIYPGAGITPRGVQCFPDISNVTRSDHIVGTCYLVGLDGLWAELRHRAAEQLIAFCGDAGYAEARRLLPQDGWMWLVSALRRGSWARLIACYLVDDESAPVKSRIAVATNLVQTATTICFPRGVDHLINSPQASSAARLRLATILARRDRTQGLPHLEALATDHTLQPIHRIKAAKHLKSLTMDVSNR